MLISVLQKQYHPVGSMCLQSILTAYFLQSCAYKAAKIPLLCKLR